MAKHIIFLVHGMGDTVQGWSEPVQKLIRDKYKLYRVSNRQKFDTNFTFQEINYNYVFQNHIKKWEENASSVTRVMEASGIDSDVLKTLMGFTTKTARKEFASTHVLDVILYRFMRGIKSQIISHISEQLVGSLNESSTVTPYSIVCHSLGTAVMHDVMQANLTTDYFPLSAIHGVPRVYMTLANVSRVLEDSDANVYTSAVRPELKDRTRLYGCSNFINVAHALDPFTKVRTFRPGWKKGAAKPLNNLRRDSYSNIKISGLTDFNTHDMEHYLENPNTHVPLFRRLLTPQSITDAELRTQVAAYKQGSLSGQLAKVRKAVNGLKLDDASTLNAAIKGWASFQQKIKTMT